MEIPEKIIIINFVVVTADGRRRRSILMGTRLRVLLAESAGALGYGWRLYSLWRY